MFAFSRLLFYWKGSIYKLIYKEMIVFCLLYATLSLNYRFILTEDQKRCCFAESDTILEVMQVCFLLLEFLNELYVIATRWPATFHCRLFSASTSRSSSRDGGVSTSTSLGPTGLNSDSVRRHLISSLVALSAFSCFRSMMYVSTLVEGSDDRSRVIRRTVMRYLSLSSLIVFQATSVVVKKRFPTMEHLLEAGTLPLRHFSSKNLYRRYTFLK